MGALVFSLALSITTVALPLLALDAGYSQPEVGLLTASSAIAQMAVRPMLGAIMRRVGDWILITAAAGLMALSSGLVVVSAAVIPFLLAELIQGVARACFWTGSQTHVVRGTGRAVGALATVNFISSFGMLVGPVLAGTLTERSPLLALATAGVASLVGIVPTLFLDRLPPFQPPPDRPPGRIWRRPGVDAGSWAGVTAGAWRGILGSYIPVALDAARQSPSMIGALVSVANGALVIGSGIVGRIRTEDSGRAFALGIVATGIGTAVTGLAAGNALVAGTALAVSGLGAGMLQTIGPAIATEAVHAEERGEVIAVTGTFRAAALFASPLVLAAALGAVTLAPAIAGVGLIMTAPAVTARRIGRPAPVPGSRARGSARTRHEERRDDPTPGA
jgi:MFS family permease